MTQEPSFGNGFKIVTTKESGYFSPSWKTMISFDRGIQEFS